MPTEEVKNNVPYKKIFLFLAIAAAAGFLIFIIVKIAGGGIRKSSAGNLILNTDKSFYILGDKAQVGVVKINEQGQPVCDANLELKVTSPSGSEKYFKTQDNTLNLTSTCSGEANVTYSPDYKAAFVLEEEGLYTLSLKNIYGKDTAEIKIEVAKESMFSIEREGATRLNPAKTDRYPMILKVKSTEKFQGKVIDYIPSSFKMIWQGKAKVQEGAGFKSISWDVDLEAGKAQEFVYEYQAPQESVGTYNLGKASIILDDSKVFEEQNYWQVIITQESAQ